MNFSLTLTFNGSELLAENSHSSMESAMLQARKIVDITTLHDLPCTLSPDGGNWIDYLATQEWKTISGTMYLAADYSDNGNAVLGINMVR